MPGLFDSLTAGMAGLKGGVLGSIGHGMAGVQNYNTLSQSLGPDQAMLAQTNPQAAQLLYQRQQMMQSYQALLPLVGGDSNKAAMLAMHPELISELGKPMALQPGSQAYTPLNLLGGGQGGGQQMPQTPPESPDGQSSQMAPQIQPQGQGGAVQPQQTGSGSFGPTNTSGVPSDDQAMQIAKQWVLGDSHALDILGRGYSGLSALARQKVMQARDQIMAQQGMTMQDVSANQMKYGGLQKTIGQMYQSNNALNTGIGHMSQLADVFQNLGNASFQPSNYVKNLFGTIIGKSGPTNYKAVVGRVAPEITRIWRGAGGAESNIERDLGTLSESNSPEQGYGAIANIAKLMGSKIDANKYQYESVFGHGSGKFMLNPENEAALGKLQQSGTTTPTNTPQQFKEGDTATNPKTGQKALFKGGRWQIQ